MFFPKQLSKPVPEFILTQVKSKGLEMSDDIQIQVLGRDDMAVLEDIRPDTFDNPIIPEQAKAFLASDLHKIVVALDQGQVIGMASGVFMLHPDKEPAFFINEVGVHKDYQRCGIGLRLARALLVLVKADGDPDIWLATEDNNAAARGLYRSLGARETTGIVVYDWGHAMDED